MSEDSSVESLKKKLYARAGAPPPRERRELHADEADTEVSRDWVRQEDLPTEEEPANDPKQELEALRQGIVPSMQYHKAYAGRADDILEDSRVTVGATQVRAKRRVLGRLVKTIFFASLAFFVIASGMAVYFFWIGNNQVSCDKIKVEVFGPVSVPSGREYLLNIGVTNKNPIPLRDTTLIFDYPEGTRDPNNSSVTLPMVRQQIGTIESGERVSASSRATLFGREHAELTVGLSLEYALKDSSATFTCTFATTSVLIATAPVSLTVDGLEELSSNQELVLTAHVTSNSEQTVPDQRLVVDYPFGFTFVIAQPMPTEGNNVWDIGDMGQGAEHTIVIKGVVVAQTTEARVVRFALGEKDKTDPRALANTLQLTEHPLLIARPFLALDFSLNGSKEPIVTAPLDSKVYGRLQWKNTLTEPLYDVEIESTLPGQYIDRSSVNVSDGYFRSIDQTLQWTPQTNSKLKEIAPGDSGVLEFSFVTQRPSGGIDALEPSMNIAFTVKGRRIANSIPVQQTLVSQAKHTLRFTTDLLFAPNILYSIGPFVNTGPHPPRVDAETTYTVVWNIKNTTSNLEDVEVHAQLPIYVSWLGAIDPPDSPVTYNPVTREVVWRAGEIGAKTDLTDLAHEVSFQVALVPSITHLGSEVVLVQNVTARGVDSFTKDVVERVVRRQTSKLMNDPMFPRDYGKVTQ